MWNEKSLCQLGEHPPLSHSLKPTHVQPEPGPSSLLLSLPSHPGWTGWTRTLHHAAAVNFSLCETQRPRQPQERFTSLHSQPTLVLLPHQTAQLETWNLNNHPHGDHIMNQLWHVRTRGVLVCDAQGLIISDRMERTSNTLGNQYLHRAAAGIVNRRRLWR